MPLAAPRVLAALEKIAPLRLAEEWDNVGLLVEHARPRRIGRLILTIDLTDAVLDEAIAERCQLVVAYHPPIFRPISRLTCASREQRIVLRAAREGIAVYSPHTALDAVEGGINDWLAEGLGAGSRRSIRPEPTGGGLRVVATLPRAHAELLATRLERSGASVHYQPADDDVTLVADGCDDAARLALETAFDDLPPTWRSRATILRLEPWLRARSGHGRLVELDEPTPLAALVRRIKRHLGLPRIRVATAPTHVNTPIRSVAVCAGAGGSVVTAEPADLYWTGEMRHHDILAAAERGTSVVLCDHTNTERGYLPGLRERLEALLGDAVGVRISERDSEPLQIV